MDLFPPDVEMEELGSVVYSGPDYDATVRPIVIAIKDGDLKKVARLLARASQYDRVNIGKLLIKEGGLPEALAFDGYNCLVNASRHGHLDFVLLLLRNGAIVDSCLSNGNTPLIVATANGHGSVVQCLLEHGSDVNLGNVDGVTALHFAASNNRIGVAQMLFHKGVAVDLRTRTGFTPLHSAAQHGHVNFADLLMKNGADLNALSPCGHSVLHGACNNLQVAMVDFLLLHGADPNTRVCDSGDTPLISRCSTNRLEIIQLLLDNGADRYGTNPRARTSLFVADVITTGVLDARGLVYETVMVGCTTGSSTVVQIGPTVSHDLQEVCANKSCVNTERTLARQFRMCGRCRRNRYCSESCQSMDWKEHRVTCHDSSCRPVGMHIGHRTYRSLVAQKEQME